MLIGMVGEFGLQSLQLNVDRDWNIIGSNTTKGNQGYRFWPYLVKGEGFFISAVRKNSVEKNAAFKIKNSIAKASKKELPIIEKWVNTKELEFVKNENTVYAWPQIHFEDMQVLLNHLRVIYSGTLIGEMMRDKLIPDHALAMSSILNEVVTSTELDLHQAVAFLQRKDISFDTQKGWQVACYKNHPLGWMNVLQNRINNYYPKELRILKEAK